MANIMIPHPSSSPAINNEIAIAVDDGAPISKHIPTTFLSRNDFPHDFIFGVGSSAIQVEGAADEGGRGKSIWDTFCEKKAAVTDDEGWLALKKGNDQYHQYETDARIIKDLGVKSYRFSFSWSRILPNGRVGKANEGVNKEGVAYYNNLINALKARGIEPCVTLFHWDLPQALDDKYGGFLSERVRADFKNYADFCFNEFGDRVKHWSTLNEPYVFSWGGFALGTMAPGHGHPPTKTKSNAQKLAHRNAVGTSNKFFPHIESSAQANHPVHPRWVQISRPLNGEDTPAYTSSATEPYIVGHNLLLSHAGVYNLYNTKYKPTQGGEIGITINSHWFQAHDGNSEPDKKAAQRELDFMLGWMMKPLTTGQYPEIMEEYVKDRLPSFTEDEAKSLINSFDFIGINYYTAYGVKDAPDLADEPPHFVTDPRAKLYPLGLKSTSNWIYVYEQGIQKLLKEIKKYGDQIAIYVTENGIDNKGDDPNMSLFEYLSDEMRIKYHYNHLFHILRAMKEDGVNVKGYYTWSFLDSFEFTNANQRFGNCFVDYDNGFKRIMKQSAYWYKFFLQNGTADHKQTINVEIKENVAEPVLEGSSINVEIKENVADPVLEGSSINVEIKEIVAEPVLEGSSINVEIEENVAEPVLEGSSVAPLKKDPLNTRAISRGKTMGSRKLYLILHGKWPRVVRGRIRSIES